MFCPFRFNHSPILCPVLSGFGSSIPVDEIWWDRLNKVRLNNIPIPRKRYQIIRFKKTFRYQTHLVVYISLVYSIYLHIIRTRHIFKLWECRTAGRIFSDCVNVLNIQSFDNCISKGDYFCIIWVCGNIVHLRLRHLPSRHWQRHRQIIFTVRSESVDLNRILALHLTDASYDY